MKISLEQDYDFFAKRLELKSDPQILTNLQYIKEHLSYQQVYAYYNLPWHGNDTHQLSCIFHASNRDARGVPYERNPSARYYAHDKQIWCFACTEGGDVSWFIKKKEGHRHYGETVDFIRRAFGIALDGQDLAKRIKLDQKQKELQESPRRQILSEMMLDKVNDEFYRLRKMGEEFHPIADRLEPEVFAHKEELDHFTGNYTDYARQLRRWHTWACELIEQSLKHFARSLKT